MGAWGYKNFENDTAVEWFSQIMHTPESDQVFKYLSYVYEESEFIDSEESFICLAIMESLSGKLKLIPTKYIFPHINDLSANIILELTIKAGKKILFFRGHSEVRELWLESEEYSEWFNYQVSLIKKMEDYFTRIYQVFIYETDIEIEEDWENYKRKYCSNE